MLEEKDLNYLAGEAKIRIKDEEKTEYLKAMNKSILIFKKLEELDLEGLEGLELISSEKNVFREDILIESYDRDELLKSASVKRNGYYSVPQIVE